VPAPDRSRHCGRDHGRLWVLLLSQSRPRDVLAVRQQQRTDFSHRIVASFNQRTDDCDNLAGRLPAADF